MLYHRQRDLFQLPEDDSPLVQEASSVLWSELGSEEASWRKPPLSLWPGLLRIFTDKSKWCFFWQTASVFTCKIVFLRHNSTAWKIYLPLAIHYLQFFSKIRPYRAYEKEWGFISPCLLVRHFGPRFSTALCQPWGKIRLQELSCWFRRLNTLVYLHDFIPIIIVLGNPGCSDDALCKIVMGETWFAHVEVDWMLMFHVAMRDFIHR